MKNAKEDFRIMTITTMIGTRASARIRVVYLYVCMRERCVHDEYIRESIFLSLSICSVARSLARSHSSRTRPTPVSRARSVLRGLFLLLFSSVFLNVSLVSSLTLARTRTSCRRFVSPIRFRHRRDESALSTSAERRPRFRARIPRRRMSRRELQKKKKKKGTPTRENLVTTL